ncbi:retrovirus-related Pol polyprotein from transposon opus [Trichonephila clavipes]|nr:retrovirus-related Pol polyprotein from transposon opus [Trichonephila clavipes]
MELAKRKRKEEMELAERKRMDEGEERRDEMDFKLQKKRIELKEGNENEVKEPGQIKIDLHILIPKFDSKSDDISLFLISFERLTAREPEKDAIDYEFVKKLLLQRFKSSHEKFRQLFVKHQKNPDDQMNKKVPTEVREHFLDEWTKNKTPKVLVEKLDEYEDVHGKTKWPSVPFINKEKSYRETIPLNARSSPSQLEDRDVRNKEGVANRRYINQFKENSHQAQYNKNRITPRCYTCDKEKNIDRLNVIKVKFVDVVLDGTEDSGAQISVESTGKGKIKLVSAFGASEVAPLRTFSIKIDDGWHDAVPITCAVPKKLVNEMLVCQTAFEALLENIQLCSVNARQVVDDETQQGEKKNSIVCEVQTFEEGSCLDIEATIDADNIESEVRSNLSSDTRRTFIKLQKEEETLISVWEQVNKKEKAYEIQNDLLVHNDIVCGEPIKQVVLPARKRKEILQIAHEIPLAGYLGEQKNQATH